MHIDSLNKLHITSHNHRIIINISEGGERVSIFRNLNHSTLVLHHDTYGEAIQNISSTFNHYYGFQKKLGIQLSFQLLETPKFKIWKKKIFDEP